MVPSLDSVHFWWSPPVQSEISTAVPALVPWPRACRHLLPYTRSSPAVFGAKLWFAPPLQSQISAAVPLAWDAAGDVQASAGLDADQPAVVGSVTVPVLVSMPQERTSSARRCRRWSA